MFSSYFEQFQINSRKDNTSPHKKNQHSLYDTIASVGTYEVLTTAIRQQHKNLEMHY